MPNLAGQGARRGTVSRNSLLCPARYNPPLGDAVKENQKAKGKVQKAKVRIDFLLSPTTSKLFFLH